MTGSGGERPERKRRPDLLNNVVEGYGRDRLDLAMDMIDIPATLRAPGAPLREWDRTLTEAIQALSQLRRGIRNEMASRS
jgi:hypothetical protein